MPSVHPLHDRVIFLAIPLQGFAKKRGVIPISLRRVVIGSLVILSK
jgi:hypothetical protein